MKNCIVCSKEFEQKTNKGLEQKYCSQLCRMKAYNERKENKANEELNELRQQAAQSNNSIIKPQIVSPKQFDNDNSLQFGNVWNSLLEGNYHKLKVESLEEKLKEKDKTIDELKSEIRILENQIESLEDEMDEAPVEQNPIMGAVNGFVKNEALMGVIAEGLSVKLKNWLFTPPKSKTA
jgi:hypothetical protein